MNHADLAAYRRAKPGATPDEPWGGDLVAEVGGTIFAFLGAERVGLTCGRTAEDTTELKAVYPDAAGTMAYIGRYGWCTLVLEGPIPDDELRELVEASYADVVARLPKKLRP